jgi:hypothetical protein
MVVKVVRGKKQIEFLKLSKSKSEPVDGRTWRHEADCITEAAENDLGEAQVSEVIPGELKSKINSSEEFILELYP